MGGLPPQPGDRTREGFMKNHVSKDRETGLYTKSPGFTNNNGNVVVKLSVMVFTLTGE